MLPDGGMTVGKAKTMCSACISFLTDCIAKIAQQMGRLRLSGTIKCYRQERCGIFLNN
jgi:hypothetical protein